MRFMRIFFRQTIGNVQKKQYNQNQGNGNLSNSIGSPKVSHFLSFLSNQTATNMNTIPRTKSTVNMAKSRQPFGKEIVVPMNGTTKKAEEMLVQIPDKTFNQGLLNFLLIALSYHTLSFPPRGSNKQKMIVNWIPFYKGMTEEKGMTRTGDDIQISDF